MEIGMVPNPTLRVRKEAKRERELARLSSFQ